MNNKFENEKAWRKKNPKGLLDTDRALHKTEHWTESLFIYIYLKSSICLRTAHLHMAEEIFLRFFCKKNKKKTVESAHQTRIRLEL